MSFAPVEENATPTGIARYLPIVSWLPRYQKGWLRFDLLAGLTAAVVVIPQAMAYAAIAGLPMEMGLYAAFVPMLLYALLGTSQNLSVSTTSTIAMITASTLAVSVQGGDSAAMISAAATLAFLTGVFLLLAFFLRLGFLANFISFPVLTGFKAGIGVVIFVGQLGKILGIPINKGGFLETISSVLRSLNDLHWLTLGITLLTLLILLFLPRLNPRLSAPMVAVVVAVLASALLHLEDFGVVLVGAIPSGLPTFVLPDFSLIKSLSTGALGIALMAFTETIASARAFVRHGEQMPDPNQELLALGIANIGGGFFHAMPAGGGASQTAVNKDAGAKTQIAGFFTVVAVIMTLLFLAPFISLMPEATLGALILVAATGLVNMREFREIAIIRKTEFWWAIIAFVGVILLGTLDGILIAVLVSVFSLLVQANHPPVYALGRKPNTDVFRPLSSEHPEDETFPGLLLARTEGRLHFASAPRAGDQLRELVRKVQPKVLAADFSAVPDIEYTALKMLTELEENLRTHGISLWLVALNPDALKVIQRSSLGKKLENNQMFFDLEHAVKAYQESRDKI